MNLLRSKYYFSVVFTLMVPLTSRLFLANEEERFVQIYGNEPLTSGRWECIREIAVLDDDVGLRAFARAAHARAYPFLLDGDFKVDSSIFGTAILVFDRHRPIQIDLLKYVTGVLSFFITKGEREDNAVFYLVKFDEDGTTFRLGRHVTDVNPRRPRTDSVAVVIPTDVRHEDLPSRSNVAAVDMRHSSASVAAVGMPYVPARRAAGIRISPSSSNVATVDVPHSPSNLVPLLPPMPHSLSNLAMVGIPVVMEQEELWDSDFDTPPDSTLGDASGDEWPIDFLAEDGLTFLDLLPEIRPTLPLGEERAPTTPTTDTNIAEAVVGPSETELDSRTEKNIEGSVGGRTDVQVTRSEALGGGGLSETEIDSRTERNIEGSVGGRTDAQVNSSEALGGGGPSDSPRAKKLRITQEVEEMVPAPEEIAASPATERVISEPLTGTIVEDVSQAAEVVGPLVGIPSALDGGTTVTEQMTSGTEEVGVSGLEEGRTSNNTTE